MVWGHVGETPQTCRWVFIGTLTLTGEHMTDFSKKGSINGVWNFAPVIHKLWSDAKWQADKPWLKDLSHITPSVLQDAIVLHLQQKYTDDDPGSVKAAVLQKLSPVVLRKTVERYVIDKSFLDYNALGKIPECRNQDGTFMMSLVSDINGNSCVKTGSKTGAIPGVQYVQGCVLMDTIQSAPDRESKRVSKDAVKFRVKSGNNADDVLAYIAQHCVITTPLQAGKFWSAHNLLDLELPGIKVPGQRPLRSVTLVDSLEDL